MKILVIKTDNTLEVKDITDDLKSMQKIVDGYIEVVFPRAAYEHGLLYNNTCMVCDEEGLCKDKPTNVLGTIFYNRLDKGKYQPIAGDIFLCGFQGEDLIGLTDMQIETYEITFKRYLEGIKRIKKEVED